MATTKQASLVKCLNKSPGLTGKRFVFKTFRERVEDIDINVFRSFQPIKTEPAEGSTFFRDALLQWRELNTAEDFISFYEEAMPIVQTLPQIILHRKRIFSALISRVRMGARLSVGAILALVAALAQDLLEQFIEFLPQLVSSLVHLLSTGGEHDSEVLEQIFTSWSYVSLYLQKYLVKDIVHILKITVDLRYYPKDHVQEFMGEAVSFLIRNAQSKQLQKGLGEIIDEVAGESIAVRKNGAVVLLWHVIRGTSSSLHSKAEEVIGFLMNHSILGKPENQGKDFADAIVMVMCGFIQRLCKELGHRELSLVWSIMLSTIRQHWTNWESCHADHSMLHISRVLSILISTLQYERRKISDPSVIVDLATFFVEKHIVPYGEIGWNDQSIELLDMIFQLMLSLLDLRCIYDNLAVLDQIALHWAPVFKLRTLSTVAFIKQLLLLDINVIQAFRVHIFSAINISIDCCSKEVIYLMLSFYGRKDCEHISNVSDLNSTVTFPRIAGFLKEKFQFLCKLIRGAANNGVDFLKKVQYSELALFWGVLSCYHHFFDKNDGSTDVKDLIVALNKVEDVETNFIISGTLKSSWQGLLAAALSLYHKLILGSEEMLSEVSIFLQAATRNKSSRKILLSVAEFLDSALGSYNRAFTEEKFVVLGLEHAVEFISGFSDNLAVSDKAVRLATLRILSHYSSFEYKKERHMEHPLKKLQLDSSLSDGVHGSHVIGSLLFVESTPISVSTSRTIITALSKIEAELEAVKISGAYIRLLSCGLLGIFHNRFTDLWGPVIDCFNVLFKKYKDFVWDGFVQYLGRYQSQFLHGINSNTVELQDPGATDIEKCFSSFLTSDSDSTPGASVLSLLLKAIQRVPDVAESHSRQLIPLFLKFLGYCEDDYSVVESFEKYQCSKKEWKSVLLEWLNLLVLMHNPCSLYNNKFVKEVLIKRLIVDMDPIIQLKVLECLLNWKDDFLLPYGEHLKNLINQKNLREELTTWSLAKKSHNINEVHRAHLVPLIIHILVAKVRSFKTLASSKHAGLNQRKAVLYFLAELASDELELFFLLLLKDLFSNHGNLAHPDTRSAMMCGGMTLQMLIRHFLSMDADCLSLKRSIGFLHVLDDILKTFDELRLKPFMDPLLCIVVRVLEICSGKPDNPEHDVSFCKKSDLCTESITGELETTIVDSSISSSKKQLKDARSSCLKIISFAINKYQDHDFMNEFWDIFFRSIKPLMVNFKQDTCSCVKPNSLLYCFVAMSQSPKLVSLLNRDANILPSILSVLTVNQTSDAVVNSVLTIIENLLSLDSDSDEGNSSVKYILRPHIELIISCLRELFCSQERLKRKKQSAPGKKEIGIFRLLVQYVDKPLVARQFFDILTPLFNNKCLVSVPDICSEGLNVIKGIVPVMDRSTIIEVFKLIQLLLISVEMDIRLIICDILNVLSTKESSLLFLAEVLGHLHAMSSSALDEPDFDTRINAYDKIKPELFYELPQHHTLVILSHCVYDMASEDLIFRQCASRSMLSFLQFASCVLNEESKNTSGFLSNVLLEVESNDLMETCKSGVWTKSSVLKVIRKVFLSNIGYAMGKEAYIQQGWMTILREMVLCLPKISSLNPLRSLCNEDPEEDFFNTIFHLQTHKRAKALSKFKKVINDGKFSEDLSVKVFVPLFFNMMIDIKEGKGEHIRNTCMELLAYLCGQMQWLEYCRFLMRCLKEIPRKADKQKLLLKLVCLVLDQFHFSDNASESLQVILDSGTALVQPNHSSVNDCSNVTIPTEIRETLQKTVLPRILKLLNPNSEKINVNVNVAALKLLKRLSSAYMELHLPSILHHICNFLKSKMEGVRDEARSVLVACLKELGLEYLQFVVKTMSSILKRGYELHILGYTLNFILSKSLTNPKVGSLDYCLEDLLFIIENDVLGDVADEKDVDKIASKMKETRNHMSFDTLMLISQNVSFKTHAMKLLFLVNSHLQKYSTSKTKNKFVSMLHHIAMGIKNNPSAELKDVLIFVYGLIEDRGVIEVADGQKLATFDAVKGKRYKMNAGNASLRSAPIGPQLSHLIVVFGLEVLNNCLKNIKLDKEDKNVLSMLDPFIKVLANCLTSKYEDVLSATFRCLIPLSRLPLPSVNEHADNIKDSLINILGTSVNLNSSLVQSCVKLLTVLLKRISLSNDQLRLLIQFPLFIDLPTNPSTMALSLLKQMVAQKLEVPELYDTVLKTAELMVTSQLEPIRRKSSHILLKFLLDYPLSDKHRQEHMFFLVTNLSYEHASGREAVLEMLNTILLKFPKRFLEDYSQLFFVHLVCALANEKESKIQSMILAVLTQIIKSSSPNTFVNNCLTWFTSKNQHLWKASAQVIALLVEVFKDGLREHAHLILQTVARILELSRVAADGGDRLFNHGELLSEEAFYSLELLGKLVLYFPEFYNDKNFEALWDDICTYLLHPHVRLQNISSHLIALYFTAATHDGSNVGLQQSIKRWFLLDPCRLFKIAVSFCIQLRSQSIDDASGNLITQNLVYAICKLHYFAKMQKDVRLPKFWATLNHREKCSFIQASNLLNSKKVKKSFLLLSTEEETGLQENHDNLMGFQSLLVESLLNKMGKIALLKEENQLKVVFRSFCMIASHIGIEDSSEYAIYMVEPLYKICEGFSGRSTSDETRQFAADIRGKLGKHLGDKYFLQIYNTVRKNLKEKREKRRQEEKLLVFTDPVRSAKRKLGRSAKRQAHKKRKIMGLKMERWKN